DSRRCPRAGEQMLALIRASHHLVHLESEDELLHTILNDAVSTLDAQRGAIVLADGPNGELRLRALATGRGEPSSRVNFSQNLAKRSSSAANRSSAAASAKTRSWRPPRASTKEPWPRC